MSVEYLSGLSPAFVRERGKEVIQSIKGIKLSECSCVVRHGTVPDRAATSLGFFYARILRDPSGVKALAFYFMRVFFYALEVCMTKAYTGAEDLLQECYFRLCFISAVFAQPKGEEFEFSQESHNGFYYIIAGIEDDIQFVLNELAQERRKEAAV